MMEKSSIEKIKNNIVNISHYINETDINVKIIAATKNISVETINILPSFGITEIGENKVQEFLNKYDKINKNIKCHFIGTLQKNKVKYIVDKISLLQSLDSIELAYECEKQCSKKNIVLNCLIEVNISNEQSKGGILPEDLYTFYDKVKDLKHINVIGLMTIGAKTDNELIYKIIFNKMKLLFDEFCQTKIPNIDNPILSMGMSSNYKIAINNGANMIRLGKAIFK